MMPPESMIVDPSATGELLVGAAAGVVLQSVVVAGGVVAGVVESLFFLHEAAIRMHISRINPYLFFMFNFFG